MKKVLIVQQMIPEYRTDFFSHLKAELEKDGIELDVVYGSENRTYQYGHSKIDFGRTYSSKKIRIFRAHLSWQPVLRYIRGHDLVIVEAANRLLINYLLIILRPVWKFKLGFWGHGRNLQAPPDSPGNKFSAMFIKKCDWWWAYTNGVKEFLIRHGYAASRITVVQNAIDTTNLNRQIAAVDQQEIRELKDQLGIHGDHVAVFCGGMYLEKRIPFILESCYLIKESIPDFQMIFIGSGEEGHFAEKAAELNSWIHFLGVKHGQERLKYFKISSLQFMPGAVGLGILDSFALQTPIVTTYSSNHGPEIEYLENGVNGVITKNTLEDYSRQIIGLFQSRKYVELFKGCADSAHIYTLEKMVENFKNGIVQCLEK